MEPSIHLRYFAQLPSIVCYLTSHDNLNHENPGTNQVLTEKQSRLEGIIRDSLAVNDHDRIAKVVHQLCHDYAYAVHQPHARNGGLIGLAAAAIALGGVRMPESSTETDTEQEPGSREISSRDSSTSPRLLLRSRC